MKILEKRKSLRNWEIMAEGNERGEMIYWHRTSKKSDKGRRNYRTRSGKEEEENKGKQSLQKIQNKVEENVAVAFP